jgi:TfoX/Sxy family transcriptional regulator of competence genes
VSKAPKDVYKDKLELYEKLIATHPEIERKGRTMPYTSHNGHMFTLLSKSGSLGIRLPKEEREAFLENYSTTLFEQYGAIMKEYVTVPEELLANTEELKEYLEVSFEYVKTLKPKPTKKKPKK